jgi:hypothetical protein
MDDHRLHCTLSVRLYGTSDNINSPPKKSLFNPRGVYRDETGFVKMILFLLQRME